MGLPVVVVVSGTQLSIAFSEKDQVEWERLRWRISDRAV
jgi:hypothetical protein